MGVSTYLMELLSTYSLIFSTSKSDWIVKTLCHDHPQGKEIQLKIIRNFTESFVDAPFQLGDFPNYGSRLKYIHERMTGWRPLHFSQLFTRPYRESIAFFAFWFGAFIGVVTFLSLVAGVVQAVFAVLAWTKS